MLEVQAACMRERAAGCDSEGKCLAKAPFRFRPLRLHSEVP